MPWDGGFLLPTASPAGFVSTGHVPTRPIFMWAPSLPGGLLIPPGTGGGLLTELPYPLNKQARASQLPPD